MRPSLRIACFALLAAFVLPAAAVLLAFTLAPATPRAGRARACIGRCRRPAPPPAINRQPEEDE